ncbi:hypothetical protein HYE68_005428 [Fusarium pseudograminearum]|nr:hypothetical protein HYE68_005428 [Fusarium pseudograminearum]
MPSATEFFGISASNLGPLTKTFTAPSSCTATTNTDHILFVNATSPYLNYLMSSSCRPKPFGDCYPSGSEYDAWGKQASTLVFGQGVYHYFSPGLACPDGWETAATLKHGSKSGEIDVSGALTVSATDITSQLYANGIAMPLHPTDFWRNVLDKSETLAFCCPSGYAGDINGFCKSTLGPLTPTMSNQPDPEVCQIWVRDGDYVFTVTSLDGVTERNGLRSLVPITATDATTTTRVLAGEWGETQLEDLAYATWVPAVTLIHQETATGSADKGEKGDDDKEKDDKNAASRIGGVVSVLGVTLWLLAGAEADMYSRTRNTGCGLKAMLLCKYVPGRVQRLRSGSPYRTRPSRGYDSVRISVEAVLMRDGGMVTYHEAVVYRHDAIIPVGVITYTK